MYVTHLGFCYSGFPRRSKLHGKKKTLAQIFPEGEFSIQTYQKSHPVSKWPSGRKNSITTGIRVQVLDINIGTAWFGVVS